MIRVLVDASGLIALAQIGELRLLRDIAGVVCVTPEVLAEVTATDDPVAEAVRLGKSEGWIRPVRHRPGHRKLARHGLGRGEASLILAARSDDFLVLDDRTARRVAEVGGLRFTGLLGLLVTAVQRDTTTKERGVDVLDRLAASSFHMSVELYQRARARMEQA